MYLVQVQLIVGGKLKRIFQFSCSDIKKDIIQQKISTLCQIKIDNLEISYYDSDSDQVGLSSQEDYQNLKEMLSLGQIIQLRMVVEANQVLPPSKESSENFQVLLREPIHFEEMLVEQPGKQNNKNKPNKKQSKQSKKQQLSTKIDQVYPNMSQKQKKKMNKNLKKWRKAEMKEDLRILKDLSKQVPQEIQISQIKEPKQGNIQEMSSNEDEECTLEGLLQQNEKGRSGKTSLMIMNYLAKLKRNIKEQVLQQLPQYIKKQCFKVIPYQINKIAQEPICSFCGKNLKQLPLPVYINNKGQFYCNDCEECLADDDELIVKIKSQKLRDQIFMVKTIPILRKDIEHLQQHNYKSQMQKYQDIIKASKKIALYKVDNTIFQEQERKVVHNRLMKEEQRVKQVLQNQRLKKAKQEHRQKLIKMKKQEFRMQLPNI